MPAAVQCRAKSRLDCQALPTRLEAGFSQGHHHPFVGVIGLVGDQRVRLHVREQVVGAVQIVSLSSGQVKPQRIARGIDDGVDLCAQPSSRASNGLVLPGFFWATALC